MGPTPFKYSMGVDNMCDNDEINNNLKTKILYQACISPVTTTHNRGILLYRKLRFYNRKIPTRMVKYHSCLKDNTLFFWLR